MPEYLCFNHFIDPKKSQVLNSKSSEYNSSLSAIPPTDPSVSIVQSDVDEQMIVSLSFRQKLNIKGIRLIGTSLEQMPKNVSLYNNRGGIDFQYSAKSDEDVTFGESLDQKIKVKPQKFRNVDSLDIFIRDNNEDGEQTMFSWIGIYGELTGMNEELKKKFISENVTHTRLPW